MVILMTFVATLRIYGIASRNFILVSLWIEGPGRLPASRAGPVHGKHARQRRTYQHPRRDQDQSQRGGRKVEARGQDGGRGGEKSRHLSAGRQAGSDTFLHPRRDGHHQLYVPVRSQRLPRGSY